MRDWLKTRFPYLYWKARNGVALAQWCTLRLRHVDSEADSYDDAFWSFHDVGDWDGFARLIINRFHPRTVWDLGCGDGKLIESIANIDAMVQATGFDHSAAARARAAARGVNVQPFDLSKPTSDGVEKIVAKFGPLEVAEHIPFWHAGRCLRILAAAQVVVFSAAQPLQGGVLHVNEQRPEYWAKKFAKLGFERDPSDADFRGAVRQLALPAWYGANVQVFRQVLKGLACPFVGS